MTPCIFFHVSGAKVKKWLSALPVTETECGGKTYYYIENGKSYANDIPECLFLAGFDQLMLGYEKKESLYLEPENMRAIFNLAGIVMAPVMLNGKVVGKWKMKGHKLSITLFARVGEDGESAIRKKAEFLWDDMVSIEFV